MRNYEIICSSIKKPEQGGFISLFLLPVITYTKPRRSHKTYCLQTTGYVTSQGTFHRSLIKCGVIQQQKVRQAVSLDNIHCKTSMWKPGTLILYLTLI